MNSTSVGKSKTGRGFISVKDGSSSGGKGSDAEFGPVPDAMVTNVEHEVSDEEVQERFGPGFKTTTGCMTGQVEVSEFSPRSLQMIVL